MAISKYKTKDGIRYRVQIYEGKKRIASKSGFETKYDAKRYEAFILSDDNSRPKSDTRFEELVERYIDTHLPTIKPNSRTRYLVDIRERILPAFKYCKVSKITNLQIEAFRSELIESGELENKSINDCMSLFYSILKKGEYWGIQNKDIKPLKKLKLEKKLYQWWQNKNDINRFLATAKKYSPYHQFFTIALTTGMRLGEIAGLKCLDIDFTHNCIHVVRQWNGRIRDYAPLKNNEQRMIYFETGSDLEEALSTLVQSAKDPDRLWLTSSGTRVLNNWISFDHFHLIREKANCTKIRFHDLRHTFASWYMIEVGDIWKLMGLLGHSSMAQTMKYSHLGKNKRSVEDMGFSKSTPLAPPKNHLTVIK